MPWRSHSTLWSKEQLFRLPRNPRPLHDIERLGLLPKAAHPLRVLKWPDPLQLLPKLCVRSVAPWQRRPRTPDKIWLDCSAQARDFWILHLGHHWTEPGVLELHCHLEVVPRSGLLLQHRILLQAPCQRRIYLFRGLNKFPIQNYPDLYFFP